MLILMEKLSKDDETSEEIQVRREDQEKINKFSSLHQRELALEQNLQAKQVSSVACASYSVSHTAEREGGS
jgi:hypothetical protein